MRTVLDFNCNDGYVCLEGLDVSNPEAGTTGKDPANALLNIGYKCPLDYHCPGNLIHKIECNDGFVAEGVGKAICDSCPEDYYCDNLANNKKKVKCIKGSKCSGAYPRQLNCPGGTYATGVNTP
jgi:hypothetical protein